VSQKAASERIEEPPVGIFSSTVGIAGTCPAHLPGGHHDFLEVPAGMGTLRATASATFRLYAASRVPEEESLVHEHLWQAAHPSSCEAYFN
jgi:hypothetical protein